MRRNVVSNEEFLSSQCTGHLILLQEQFKIWLGYAKQEVRSKF